MLHFTDTIFFFSLSLSRISVFTVEMFEHKTFYEQISTFTYNFNNSSYNIYTSNFYYASFLCLLSSVRYAFNVKFYLPRRKLISIKCISVPGFLRWVSKYNNDTFRALKTAFWIKNVYKKQQILVWQKSLSFNRNSCDYHVFQPLHFRIWWNLFSSSMIFFSRSNIWFRCF